MSKLSDIMEFAQQVSEAIASVLGIEVQMIDDQLRLCVGTGIYLNKRDRVFDATSASYYVIEKGEPIVIEQARQHDICLQCTHRDHCVDLAEICYPIIIDGKPMGVIALIAQKEDQKRALLINKEKLFKYIERMAGLISYVVKASELNQQVCLLMEAQEKIMNSIQEGIISIDYQGNIVFVNQSSASLLSIESNVLLKKHISEIFDKTEDILINLKSMNAMETELFTTQDFGNRHFIGTVTPVTLVSGEKGLVICFRDINTIPKMVRTFLRKERKITFNDILGTSKDIITLKQQAMQVAKNDSSIFIFGESGTGKEMFARAIHYASMRSNGPLISINCGAIPEGLLESELFGYEEGAFTGAKKGGKPGQFELANYGTLFLDELGDMPLHLQVKILRALEEKQVTRVGGTRPNLINVRIIAATNKNIEELIERGEFRGDLYFRLNVIPVHISPLRKRLEDVKVYVDYFIKKYNEILNKSVKGCSLEVMEYLENYSWPGNVRELENIIEYSINMENSSEIRVVSLPKRVLEKGKTSSVQSIREKEKQLIIEAIKNLGSTVKAKEKIAKSLGISKSTLYRKIKQYKLDDQKYREFCPSIKKDNL